MKTWKQFLKVREANHQFTGTDPVSQMGRLENLPNYDDNRLPKEVEKAKESALERFSREVGEVNQAVVSILDDLIFAITGTR